MYVLNSQLVLNYFYVSKRILCNNHRDAQRRLGTSIIETLNTFDIYYFNNKFQQNWSAVTCPVPVQSFSEKMQVNHQVEWLKPLTVEIIKRWNAFLQALAFTGLGNNLCGLGRTVEWISGQNLPMVEYALWESLTTGVRAQISGKTQKIQIKTSLQSIEPTERLVDRQVGLDDEHWSTGNLLFFKDVTTTTIEHTVDATNSGLGTLNFDQVDGLKQTRLGSQNGSVEDTASSWNDLEKWADQKVRKIVCFLGVTVCKKCLNSLKGRISFF